MMIFGYAFISERANIFLCVCSKAVMMSPDPKFSAVLPRALAVSIGLVLLQLSLLNLFIKLEYRTAFVGRYPSFHSHLFP